MKFNARGLTPARGKLALRFSQKAAQDFSGLLSISVSETRKHRPVRLPRIRFDRIEQLPAFRRQADRVSAPVLHCPLALDDPALEKPLHDIGERGAVDAGQPDKVRLAEPFMLGDSCEHRILPGGKIEMPCLERKNFRRALAGAMKKMNHRAVDVICPPCRCFLPLFSRAALAYFCVHILVRLLIEASFHAKNGTGNRSVPCIYGKIRNTVAAKGNVDLSGGYACTYMADVKQGVGSKV